MMVAEAAMVLALWMAIACAERPEATVVRGDDVGAEACPDVGLDPGDVNFGEVVVGDRTFVPLTLTNGGDRDIEVLDVEVDGDDAFSADPPSRPVAPGESAEVTVYFQPEEPGVAEADVVVETDLCGDLDVHVAGEGVEAR